MVYAFFRDISQIVNEITKLEFELALYDVL